MAACADADLTNRVVPAQRLFPLTQMGGPHNASSAGSVYNLYPGHPPLLFGLPGPLPVAATPAEGGAVDILALSFFCASALYAARLLFRLRCAAALARSDCMARESHGRPRGGGLYSGRHRRDAHEL